MFLLLATGAAASAQTDAPTVLPFSDMVRMAQSGNLASVDVLDDSDAVAVDKHGRSFAVRTPFPHTWAMEFAKEGVKVEFANSDPAGWAQSFSRGMGLVAQLLGIVLVGGLMFMLSRGLRKMKVGEWIDYRNRTDRVLFEHVAGAEEVKEQLADIVAYLKDPDKFAMVPKPPKGIVMAGGPGTGKTLSAKAIAGEAGVPFLAVSGSDFQEMFAGLGAARVRRMFKDLRKRAPAILFIDEAESLGRKRSDGGGAVERDGDATLNQMLAEMDGFKPGSGIIVIAATNRPDMLDPAFVRSGRFDRLIVVPDPSLEARVKILEVSSKDVPLASDVDLKVIARGTPGFSGADLAGLVNDSAIRAVKRGSAVVEASDFEDSRDRKLLGGDRVTRMLDEGERKVIAYHEAGHAVTAVLQPECDPLHKGTIAPRGRSLGHVAPLPDKDSVLVRRSKLKAYLVMAMGGRAAEEIVFGEDCITTGAAADILEATKRARAMIAAFGMGSTMANREDAAGAFEARRISEETKRKVDEEVEVLLRDAYAKAVRLLTDRRDALDRVAEAFLEEETLSGGRIKALVEERGLAGDSRAA